MAYATVAEAIELYGEDYVTVSFDRNNDGVLDTAAATRMLDVATAKINGYLKGRITLPLASVPDDLKKYCIDIAIYEGCPRASVMTEQKRDRNEAAMVWLRGIRDNKIVLADVAGERQGGPNEMQIAEAVPMAGNQAELIEGSREFTRQSLGLLI